MANESRRGFLQRLGLAAGAGCAACAGAARAGRSSGAAPMGPVLRPPVGGSADPVPIPWLDKNGSHNQSPGPGLDPSSVYDFRGRIARANDFTGSGTSGDGERLAWGATSSDFSFMDGEYFPTDRIARDGTFSHL